MNIYSKTKTNFDEIYIDSDSEEIEKLHKVWFKFIKRLKDCLRILQMEMTYFYTMPKKFQMLIYIFKFLLHRFIKNFYYKCMY